MLGGPIRYGLLNGSQICAEVRFTDFLSHTPLRGSNRIAFAPHPFSYTRPARICANAILFELARVAEVKKAGLHEPNICATSHSGPRSGSDPPTSLTSAASTTLREVRSQHRPRPRRRPLASRGEKDARPARRLDRGGLQI